MPNRSSLQTQASIISNNLLSVSEHLSENQALLGSLVAYPGPSYPGRTQSNTLEQLLRTKLDPRVEDWVARGRKAGDSALHEAGGLSEAQLAELWRWAPVEANQEARKRNWGGNFTLEEKSLGVQNVVTGLRMQLEEEEGEEGREEEEEEEVDDEMEVVGVRRRSGAGSGLEFDIAAATHQRPTGPVVPLNETLRYMTTGAPPGQR